MTSHQVLGGNPLTTPLKSPFLVSFSDENCGQPSGSVLSMVYNAIFF